MFSSNMPIKLTKVGDSCYLITPSEYVKVYNLRKYNYNIEVSSDGKTIIYKRAGLNKDYVEESNTKK